MQITDLDTVTRPPASWAHREKPGRGQCLTNPLRRSIVTAMASTPKTTPPLSLQSTFTRGPQGKHEGFVDYARRVDTDTYHAGRHEKRYASPENQQMFAAFDIKLCEQAGYHLPGCIDIDTPPNVKPHQLQTSFGPGNFTQLQEEDDVFQDVAVTKFLSTAQRGARIG